MYAAKYLTASSRVLGVLPESKAQGKAWFAMLTCRTLSALHQKCQIRLAAWEATVFSFGNGTCPAPYRSPLVFSHGLTKSLCSLAIVLVRAYGSAEKRSCPTRLHDCKFCGVEI